MTLPSIRKKARTLAET